MSEEDNEGSLTKMLIKLAVWISERGVHLRCPQIKMTPPFDSRCCPPNQKIGV